MQLNGGDLVRCCKHGHHIQRPPGAWPRSHAPFSLGYNAGMNKDYFPEAGSCAGVFTLILISLAICVWVFLHSGVAG